MDVFITLDYELYLGSSSGSIEKCLLLPMNELCRIADDVGFKYVIFVDAAYLLRLKSLRNKSLHLFDDYEKIVHNISMLALRGHDIQLHFHPQWLFSNWNDHSQLWEIDRLHYKLSDVETDMVFSTFEEAKRVLDEIVGYSTYSFRAGGYCLSSFKHVDRLFEENGIRIDSSVARHQYTSSALHEYDYRHIPSKHIYRFTTDVCEEETNGKYIELSISDISWSALKYYLCIRKKMRNYSPTVIYKDGTPVKDSPASERFARIKKLITPYKNLISLDGIRACQLEDAYEYSISNKYDNLVIIGHPKAATDASLRSFSSFMNFISKHHNICTTKDINII